VLKLLVNDSIMFVKLLCDSIMFVKLLCKIHNHCVRITEITHIAAKFVNWCRIVALFRFVYWEIFSIVCFFVKIVCDSSTSSASASRHLDTD
jgi:hypothetical protein